MDTPRAEGRAEPHAETAEATGAEPTGVALASGPTPAGGIPRGTRLGRFLVLDQLGAGGMGVVVAAYDPELDRKVAVKLLRPDRLDTARSQQSRARLLREAQAMARVSHSNVITVHEVGTLDDQVFVVMDLVDGATAADWVAERPRTWREVIDIYVQAGRGLAAAHRAGLVHRDFKPHNVLVGRDGRVVVTDFGLVAPASPAGEPGMRPGPDEPVDPRLTPSSGRALELSLTRTGALIGSPAYMAPEQHLREATDPRTDQFSFCVALYEALYGARPFAGETYRELLETVTGGRVREPPGDSRVPGWLRRVLLRGLAVDPAARFPGMDDLLAALTRDPAAPRRRFLAAAVALLAAAAGLLAYRRLSAAPPAPPVCRGAAEKLDGVWDAAARRRIEAAFAGTGVAYAGDAFRRTDAVLDAYAGAWVAMRTDACEATRVRGDQSEALLDLRIACLDRRLGELAALAAVLQSADAAVVERAAQAGHALSRLDACADVAALMGGARLPDDAGARAAAARRQQDVAAAKARGDAGKYADAIPFAERGLAAARAMPSRPLVAESLLQLGQLAAQSGDAERGDAVLDDAAWAAEASGNDAVAAEAWLTLVFVRGYLRADGARGHEAARRATAAIERAGGAPELAGRLQISEGAVFYREGKLTEALAHWELGRDTLERALGPDDLQVAKVLNNLGSVCGDMGRRDQAIAYLGRALAIWNQTVGPEHPLTANAHNNLGTIYREEGRYEQALAEYDLALAVWQRALGADHANVIAVLANQGNVLEEMGRHEEALARYQRGIDVLERTEGPDHVALALPLVSRASSLAALGRFDQAIADDRRAIAIWEKASPGTPQTAFAYTSLGEIANRRRAYREAEGHFRRARALWERSSGPDNPLLAYALHGLGLALIEQGRAAEALPLLERAVALRADAPAVELAASRFELGRALAATGGDRARARSLADQALSVFRAAHRDQEAGEVEAWLRAAP